MSESDSQSEPEVVALIRDGIITACECLGAEVLEYILQRVAAVPYLDDVQAYITHASAVLRVATEEAMRPRMDALKAESAMYRAQAEAMEAQYQKSMHEWEAFLRMKTPRTIQ